MTQSSYGKLSFGAGHYSRAAGLTATLAVTQDAQMLAGAAGSVVKGTLVATQASQTLTAAGGSIVLGTLNTLGHPGGADHLGRRQGGARRRA